MEGGAWNERWGSRFGSTKEKYLGMPASRWKPLGILLQRTIEEVLACRGLEGMVHRARRARWELRRAVASFRRGFFKFGESETHLFIQVRA